MGTHFTYRSLSACAYCRNTTVFLLLYNKYSQDTVKTMTMVYFSIVAVILIIVFAMKAYKILFRRLSFQSSFYCRDNKLTAYLFENCKALQQPFCPSAWLENKHMQTVIPSILRKWFQHGVTFERELITVEDGEHIALDWAILDGVVTSKTRASDLQLKDIIMILPGMTASAESFTSTCKVGIQHGFRVVVFNKRGHGGNKITKPLLKGFGDSSDLQSVLKIIKSK